MALRHHVTGAIERGEKQPIAGVSSSKITFGPENEAKAAAWLATRGGIAVWRNVNLSSHAIGSETYTPANAETGEPTGKPSWQVSFDRIVPDPAEVQVEEFAEVARCKVVRGKYGPPCDPIARGRVKLDALLEQAGEGAWGKFDYSNMNYGSPWCEAVVMKRVGLRPLNMAATSDRATEGGVS